MTDDEADFKLLSLANEKGKFAMSISEPSQEELQFAFERGIDNEWFRFVDVSPISSMNSNEVFKIFMLNSQGWKRLKELKDKFAH